MYAFLLFWEASRFTYNFGYHVMLVQSVAAYCKIS